MNDKNFGLTEGDFTTLVSDLRKGKEELFEKIFLSQFENSIRFLMSKYKVQRETSYDICMDSLIYFRELLVADKLKYGNLRALFNQISYQKYLKHLKKQNKVKVTDEVPEMIMEDNEAKEEHLGMLNIAWSKLGAECQRILKGFYYNNQKLYEIAEELNKTAGATRKQKERCISVLRSNFKQATHNYE